MAFGIGVTSNVDFGDPDAWSGPENGVDLQAHAGGLVQAKSYRMSEDAYLAIVILVALGILWLFGLVVFKTASI